MEKISNFMFWTVAILTLLLFIWVMVGCTFTNPTLWKNLIRNQADVFGQMIDDSNPNHESPCVHSDIYIY